jgi:hypothetical protein
VVVEAVTSGMADVQNKKGLFEFNGQILVWFSNFKLQTSADWHLVFGV